MDLFHLGCESIISNYQSIGKINVEKVSPTWTIPPIDVIMENLYPTAARCASPCRSVLYRLKSDFSMPRYLQKAYAILGAVLEGAFWPRPLCSAPRSLPARRCQHRPGAPRPHLGAALRPLRLPRPRPARRAPVRAPGGR